MSGAATAAAPAGGDGGISGRSRSSVAVPRGPRNGCAADHDAALVLDAVLVGLLALDDPAARDVDDTWCDAPRWREAARALVAHRLAGGRLGDLLSAADALVERALGVYLPRTTAADAILAALEAAPGGYVVAQARKRRVRLELRRVAQALDTLAAADLDVVPRQVAHIQRALAAIAAAAREVWHG